MSVVLITGGRELSDKNSLFDSLDLLHGVRPFGKVVQGGATGADELAWEWAVSRGIVTDTYPADWKTHEKAAGPIRNKRMLVDGKPDFIVAFPGGKGTSDMIKQAKKAKVEVMTSMGVRYEPMATAARI